MGPSNGLSTRFRHAKVLHLACSNQFLHGARDVFNRYIRIDAVLIKQVDAIGSQTFQRSLHVSSDVFWAAVHPTGWLAFFEAKLRRNYNLVAEGFQRLAHKFLIEIRAIRLGCVEERYPTFKRRANQGDSRLLFYSGAESITQSHAA